MKKIAGTVTLYNPDDEVISNINSYLNDIGKLYVVDNSSNDTFKEKLKGMKKVVYIPNNKNLGVATALNIGARRAIEDGYEWLLTMDQDSQFKKDAISSMLDYIEKNKNINIGLVTPWHNIKTGIKKPKKRVEEMVEVMTSGNIINLDAYKKIGGYKDWLFIDGIDFEYCMNLNINGYKVIRLNYIVLDHELGDIKVKHILNRDFVCSNHNYIRRYYMARNNHYIYDMYKEYFPEYCTLIKHGLKGAARNIFVFEKDKYRKLRNMYRGYRDYKKGIKGVYPYTN